MPKPEQTTQKIACIVPTLLVGMHQVTLQRCVTQSVTGFIPTQSVGTMRERVRGSGKWLVLTLLRVMAVGMLINSVASAQTLDQLKAELHEQKIQQQAKEHKARQQQAESERKKAKAKEEAVAEQQRSDKLAVIEAEKNQKERETKKLLEQNVTLQKKLEKYKTPTIPKTTVTEPVMVDFSAGSFTMGCVEGRDNVEGGCSSDEKPAHKVEVGAFSLAATEVTKGQFSEFVSLSHYKTDAEKTDGCYGWAGSGWNKDKKFNWRNPGFEQSDEHPVVCVSWNDALAYIDWLNEKTGKNYRLPTEAEWEYAVRGGDKNNHLAFPWGNSASHEFANYGKDVCCEGLISGRDQWFFSSPVKSFSAHNGLYDMAGNVWEWTCSAYDSSYAGKDAHCTDNSTASPRVVRGGSWSYDGGYTRSASRLRFTPDVGDINLGFRLALGL